MPVESRIIVHASKKNSEVYTKLLAAQDRVSKDQLETLGRYIIDAAKSFIDSPNLIHQSQDIQPGEGTTASGTGRIHQVGIPRYNLLIKESFGLDFRGSNAHTRRMRVMNDAPLSVHVHEGSDPDEINSETLKSRLQSWAKKKIGEGAFTAEEINSLYEIIISNGIPPLPYLRSAAYMTLYQLRSQFIRELRRNIKAAAD